MIGIINTGETNADGEHVYRLQVNQWVKGTFCHNRRDGLAACLEKAAQCAREYEREERESAARFWRLFDDGTERGKK